jgi:uncharacterized membrane protein
MNGCEITRKSRHRDENMSWLFDDKGLWPSIPLTIASAVSHMVRFMHMYVCMFAYIPIPSSCSWNLSHIKLVAEAFIIRLVLMKAQCQALVSIQWHYKTKLSSTTVINMLFTLQLIGIINDKHLAVVLVRRPRMQCVYMRASLHHCTDDTHV